MSTALALADDGHDDEQNTPRGLVEEFHRTVGRIFSVNRVTAPPMFFDALENGLFLAWSHYAEMLFELDTTLEQRRALRQAWKNVELRLEWQNAELLDRRAGSTKVRQQRTPRGQIMSSSGPGVVLVNGGRSAPAAAAAPGLPGWRPMQYSELQAITEAQFVALLNLVGRRSGLTVPQWAARAGVAKSQVYSLFKRCKLPSRPEQVQSLLTAGGLPDDQVKHVMALWNELREARTHPARSLRGGPADQALAERLIRSVRAKMYTPKDSHDIDIVTRLMTGSHDERDALYLVHQVKATTHTSSMTVDAPLRSAAGDDPASPEDVST